MKILIAFSFACFSLNIFACTDFSGRYQNDDLEFYNVLQSGCTQIQIADKTLKADGLPRLDIETNSLRITTVVNFIEDYLSVENKLEYKTPFPPEMPTDLIPAKFVTLYVIDWKGNLAIDTTVYNSLDEVISSENVTHQKQ